MKKILIILFTVISITAFSQGNLPVANPSTLNGAVVNVQHDGGTNAVLLDSLLNQEVATINNGRIWYVSKNNPQCSASAVVGDPTRPFCNPWQAVDSLQAGDKVHVYPAEFIYGTDDCTTCDYQFPSMGQNNLWQVDSLTWHFDKGVKFINPASSGGIRLFVDTSGYHLTVTGDAEFDITSKNGIVDANNLNSKVYFEANKITAKDETGWGNCFHIRRFKHAEVDIDTVDVRTYQMFYGGVWPGNSATLKNTTLIWRSKKVIDDKSDAIMRIDGPMISPYFLIEIDEIHQELAYNTWIFGRYYQKDARVIIRFKKSTFLRETETTIFGNPSIAGVLNFNSDMVSNNIYDYDLGISTITELGLFHTAQAGSTANPPNLINIKAKVFHTGTGTNNFLSTRSSSQVGAAIYSINADVSSNLPLIYCPSSNTALFQISGRYKNTTAGSAIASFINATTKCTFRDAILINDASVPAVESTVARNVGFINTVTNSLLTDSDVTEIITPLIKTSSVW